MSLDKVVLTIHGELHEWLRDETKDVYNVKDAEYWDVVHNFLPSAVRGLGIHSIVLRGVNFDDLTEEQLLALQTATTTWRQKLARYQRLRDMVFKYEDLVLDPVPQDTLPELTIKEDTKIPETNTLWRHGNGNLYEVLGVANQHADQRKNPGKYVPRVIYRGVMNAYLWEKPLSEWYEKMTPEVNVQEMHADAKAFTGEYRW